MSHNYMNKFLSDQQICILTIYTVIGTVLETGCWVRVVNGGKLLIGTILKAIPDEIINIFMY